MSSVIKNLKYWGYGILAVLLILITPLLSLIGLVAGGLAFLLPWGISLALSPSQARR
ncbi:MAG: hypothetical protein PHI73_00065 [Patescibacteria group bacterium]|nr:hypothetical protein [Patescibacteria group bacterium]